MNWKDWDIYQDGQGGVKIRQSMIIEAEEDVFNHLNKIKKENKVAQILGKTIIDNKLITLKVV